MTGPYFPQDWLSRFAADQTAVTPAQPFTLPPVPVLKALSLVQQHGQMPAPSIQPGLPLGPDAPGWMGALGRVIRGESHDPLANLLAGPAQAGLAARTLVNNGHPTAAALLALAALAPGAQDALAPGRAATAGLTAVAERIAAARAERLAAERAATRQAPVMRGLLDEVLPATGQAADSLLSVGARTIGREATMSGQPEANGKRVFYHVAGSQYRAGNDLMPFNALREHGINVRWKWPDADMGYDGDMISLHDDLGAALAHKADIGGVVYRVEIDPDELARLGGRLGRNEEGFTVVSGSNIPGEWITKEPLPKNWRAMAAEGSEQQFQKELAQSRARNARAFQRLAEDLANDPVALQSFSPEAPARQAAEEILRRRGGK